MRAEVIVPMVAERTAVQMTWDEGA